MTSYFRQRGGHSGNLLPYRLSFLVGKAEYGILKHLDSKWYRYESLKLVWVQMAVWILRGPNVVGSKRGAPTYSKHVQRIPPRPDLPLSDSRTPYGRKVTRVSTPLDGARASLGAFSRAKISSGHGSF